MTQTRNEVPPTGTTDAATGAPVVEMRDISITFGTVRALDGVDLRIFPGEVHALMGENGAGKSTMIKALTGVYSIDSGTVVVGGEEHSFSTPAAAQAAGISTVYQEVNLVPNLSVAENMLLGREPRRFGVIQGRAMRRRARQTLERLGLDIDPGSQLGDHPIAVQQLVAIARAVDVDCRVLVLDEPTSSLDADEVERLFALMRRLRDDGVAIVFVSHFLDQIYAIADRMTILRNGRLVEERMVAETPQIELVQLMIGRELAVLDRLEKQAHGRATTEAEPVLQAIGLGRKGTLEATDLAVHPGEVIGVAGLLGSGRTELARLLFGADTADTGDLQVGSTRRRIRSPRHAIDRKIAFSSEDRKAEGVIADLTVADNMMLALQASRGWLRPVPAAQRTQLVEKYIEALDIRPADPNALMRNLSGGNQQKVLLARWLITEPDLLILDEPTRGIDIGAKAQIQALVADLAAQGLGVVFISAELEEVLRLSDRLVVMRDRRKIAERTNDGVSVRDVLEIIAGEARTDDSVLAAPADDALAKASAAQAPAGAPQTTPPTTPATHEPAERAQ
jgi:galactofuranose transport system ATP-binding protein